MSKVDFVFMDSGTGGIPYMLQLKKVCPTASCVYVADTEHFPYGEKTHEQIVKLVLALVEKIIYSFEPKVIVIACNTMSVNTLDVLREVFPDQHFVGTVPAIKLAASVSKKRRIGLLATKATIENPYNLDLKNHFASDCELVLRGDGELISFIEHKSFTATQEERELACVPSVEFFKQKDCDVIILGCTHFLNVKDEMQKVCGKEIQVVDSVDGVVNRALSLCKGVAGMCPAQGVTEKTGTNAVSEDFGVQGASPSYSSLYITGFCDKNDEKEYDVICERYALEFGGVLI